MAGSLCKLIEEPAQRIKAPMVLVDAHINAIRAAVRDDIRDSTHPMGKVIAEELERQVAAYVASEKSSTTAP